MIRRKSWISILILPILAGIGVLSGQYDTVLAQNRTGQDKIKILASGGFRTMAGVPSAPPSTADITVCPSGCDQTTVAGAITAATAGDIIELRASTPGGTRTINGTVCINFNGKDGATGLANHITVRVRDGDRIILDCTSQGILIRDSNYITIDGGSRTDDDGVASRGGLIVGDKTDWNATDGGGSAAQDNGVVVDQGSTHIVIKNLTMYGGSERASCNYVDRTTQYVWVHNVRADLCGTNNNSVGLDSGNLFEFGPIHGLITNSEFTHGGHNGMQIFGIYNVVRNSIGDGYWVDKNTGSPGARAANVIALTNTNWQPAEPAGSPLLPTTFGPNMLENNIFKRSGNSVDQTNNAAHKTHGYHLILRQNFYWDLDATIYNGPGYGGVTTDITNALLAARHKIYHNTSINTKGVFGNGDAQFTTSMGNGNNELNTYINNIFAEVANSKSGNGDVVDWDADNVAQTSMLHGFTNSWKGTVWTANNFSGTAARMSFRLRGVGAAQNVSVTNNTTWAANIFGNTNITPTFVNAAARTKAGLQLATSSPVGRNDAAALTTTTTSGTADTTLTLTDPYFFYVGNDTDNWDLGYFGETGDCIAVSTTNGGTTYNVTQITDINYGNGNIVVSPGVTHAVGSSVYMASKNADGTCGTRIVNRGAWQ